VELTDLPSFPVSTPKRKHPLTVTIGYGVLMLQALSLPFAFATALRTASDQPTWASGLYLAADLAALAALGLIAFGRQTHRPTARFAPAVLVLPAWAVIALVSPLTHASFGSSAMYSLYALVAGALSSVPFLTRDGLELFATGDATVAASTGITRPTA